MTGTKQTRSEIAALVDAAQTKPLDLATLRALPTAKEDFLGSPSTPILHGGPDRESIQARCDDVGPCGKEDFQRSPSTPILYAGPSTRAN